MTFAMDDVVSDCMQRLREAIERADDKNDRDGAAIIIEACEHFIGTIKAKVHRR